MIDLSHIDVTIIDGWRSGERENDQRKAERSERASGIKAVFYSKALGTLKHVSEELTVEKKNAKQLGVNQPWFHWAAVPALCYVLQW